jgi:hypothetical protein
MKTPLTLTLTVSLIATSLPAAAQFPFPPAPRYAPPPRQQYLPPPVSSDWSHVAAIAPGTKVVVSAVGLGGQDSQYFISATDRELTLLALANADLPRAASKFVIKLAGTHPDIFMVPQRWFEYRDGSARVNPDGVFVGGRKVADLSDITKTIRAGDVAEVSAELRVQRPPGPDVDPEARGISALAFLGGLYATLAICKDKCGAAALLPPIGAAAVAGVLASRRSARTMQVIYRVR